MTALWCIFWAVIAAVAAWRLTWARASATLCRLEAEARKEIRHLQAEASWHQAKAAQVAEQAVAKAMAWKQGRDDVIAMMPLFAAAQGGCDCASRQAEEVAETA